MPRTTKPANGSSESPRPVRTSKKGNGSTGAHLADPDAIARRAYEIFKGRGGGHGADLDDWLEAERQLKGSTGVTAPAPAKPRRRKASEVTGL
jgi:hypothetical protein